MAKPKATRVQMGEQSAGAHTYMDGTIGARYQVLEQEREPYLKSARDLSMLTIPHLVPPEGSRNQELYIPYQSVGGEGIDNLRAKLLLALFPPGQPFFKLEANQFDLREFEEVFGDAAQQEALDARGKVEEGLGQTERDVYDEFEQMGVRAPLAEHIAHLLVAGNSIFRFLPNLSGARQYPLDQFVVTRDNEGTLTEFIIKETLSARTLPETILQYLLMHNKMVQDAYQHEKSDQKTIEVFTRVRRDKRLWRVVQEIGGQEIPGTHQTYRIDGQGKRLPWVVSRLTRVDGEAYGRGYEKVRGALWTLESLTQSIVEFGAAASKVLFMVDPSGVTDEDVLEEDSGSVVEGNADDVSVLSMEKFADMRFVAELAGSYERRLDSMFLRQASVQRDAERVTAEEIRLLATELEDSLGGIYPLLGEELQRPIVDILISHLAAQGRIGRLDDRDVRFKVVTGLEALGRNRDLQRLEALFAGIIELYGPEEAADWLPLGPYLTRRATALGVDIKGLVRDEAQVQQIRQQRQQQALAEKAVPNAVTQMGQAAQSGNTPEGG